MQPTLVAIPPNPNVAEHITCSGACHPEVVSKIEIKECPSLLLPQCKMVVEYVWPLSVNLPCVKLMPGYNCSACPATASTAVPMMCFPRQQNTALATSQATTAFHQNTNSVLTTSAVPRQHPAQFAPPAFTPTQGLLGATPPFTHALRPSLFHKSKMPGKVMKRKLDDMKDKSSTTMKTHAYGQNLYCKVCCVTLNAPLQARQHFEGKNHAKKLKMFTEEKSLCDNNEDSCKQVHAMGKGDQVSSVPSSSVTIQATIATATPTVPVTKVTTAVNIATNNNKFNTSSSVKRTDTKSPNQTTDKTDTKKLVVTTKQSPSTKAELNPEIYCKICGVSFNSPKQAQQHYQGKNHSKRVRAVNKAAAHNCKKMETRPGNIKQVSKFKCVRVTSQLDNNLKGMRHQMTHRSSKLLNGRWNNIKYTALNRLLCGTNFYYSKL